MGRDVVEREVAVEGDTGCEAAGREVIAGDAPAQGQLRQEERQILEAFGQDARGTRG